MKRLRKKEAMALAMLLFGQAVLMPLSIYAPEPVEGPVEGPGEGPERPDRPDKPVEPKKPPVVDPVQRRQEVRNVTRAMKAGDVAVLNGADPEVIKEAIVQDPSIVRAILPKLERLNEETRDAIAEGIEDKWDRVFEGKDRVGPLIKLGNIIDKEIPVGEMTEAVAILMVTMYLFMRVVIFRKPLGEGIETEEEFEKEATKIKDAMARKLNSFIGIMTEDELYDLSNKVNKTLVDIDKEQREKSGVASAMITEESLRTQAVIDDMIRDRERELPQMRRKLKKAGKEGLERTYTLVQRRESEGDDAYWSGYLTMVIADYAEQGIEIPSEMLELANNLTDRALKSIGDEDKSPQARLGEAISALKVRWASSEDMAKALGIDSLQAIALDGLINELQSVSLFAPKEELAAEDKETLIEVKDLLKRYLDSLSAVEERTLRRQEGKVNPEVRKLLLRRSELVRRSNKVFNEALDAVLRQG